VPVVPEPAELATASLFASLGVAGVLLRRKKKSNDDM
jgi:LPXTG-motif cell wall-anchored protein